MDTTNAFYPSIDEDNDCWAVRDANNGQIVATLLDMDVATLLAEAYNAKATETLGVEHIMYAIQAPA